MTYEEAVTQCDPFAVSYIWSGIPNLDTERCRYVVVVRTSDWKSTAFNFYQCRCVDRIRKVAGDYYTWESSRHFEHHPDMNQWHQGSIDDMAVWARELFL